MPDRRIIAISASLGAYDELQKIKANRTWTGYMLQLALLEQPDNETLKSELANLPKHEPKEQKATKKAKATKGKIAEAAEQPSQEVK